MLVARALLAPVGRQLAPALAFALGLRVANGGPSVGGRRRCRSVARRALRFSALEARVHTRRGAGDEEPDAAGQPDART